MNWQLLPTDEFNQQIAKSLANSLNRWTENDFESFSLIRVQSPLILSQEFESLFHKKIIEELETMPETRFFEVYTAELVRQNLFDSHLPKILDRMQEILQSAKAKELHVERVKDFYRLILWLKTFDNPLSADKHQSFTSLVESNLLEQGLQLEEGGAAGFREHKIGEEPNRWLKLVAKKLEEVFKEPCVYEATNSYRPGFFDPVDLFCMQGKIIVEWDGMQHYHRQLSPQGKILGSPETFTLAPRDQLKDQVLRNQGLFIVRFQKHHFQGFSEEEIITLIQRQEPNFSP